MSLGSEDGEVVKRQANSERPGDGVLPASPEVAAELIECRRQGAGCVRRSLGVVGKHNKVGFSEFEQYFRKRYLRSRNAG